MTARTLSAPDAALLGLYAAGAAARPAPSNASAEALGELRKSGLVIRVHGGYVLSASGTAKARTLAAKPTPPGAARA